MPDVKMKPSSSYFDIEKGIPIKIPSMAKTFVSRIALPMLSLVSREKALDLGLIPIDDERVIMALKNVKGRALDVGCGANNFIRSYGNGLGVDVFNWEGTRNMLEAHIEQKGYYLYPLWNILVLQIWARENKIRIQK